VLQYTTTTYLVCGVLQGSELGPILFVLYIVDLIQLVESHRLSPHLYADDVQVSGSCSPAAVDAFSTKISDCADDIADWERSNRLMLNPDKSEAIWCTTSRRQHQLPTATIPIVGVPITPARSVRDLGIYIDADLSMRAHVNRTVSRCFANGLPKAVMSSSSLQSFRCQLKTHLFKLSYPHQIL